MPATTDIFRYMRQPFALDALVNYRARPRSALCDDDAIITQAPEAKYLTDTIKVLAFRAETVLVQHLTGQGVRAVESGRAQVREMLASRADIVPQPEAQRLLIRIHAPTDPRQNRALAGLCKALNASEVRYPGTDLLLVYEPLPWRESARPRQEP